MELLPIITIPTIFLIMAYLKPYLQPRFPLPICAICTAVSGTWLILLTLWFFNFEISEITIGILMGMSTTGIMYTLAPIYKKAQIETFWFIRLAIILGGFATISMLLIRSWSALILVVILTFISVFIATAFFAKQKSNGKKASRLKDCC